jgi:hypothetical protein
MFFHTCSVWRRPRAACAFSVLVFLSADAFADISPRSLTHKEAIRRVLANNPELHAFSWRQDALRGELLVADQAAGYQLELETENLRRHSDGLEVTLALSSVVELGNKRGARTTVADSRLWLVESERQAAALDLIGRATQRFVGVLSLQEKLKVVDEAVTLGLSSWLARDLNAGRPQRKKFCVLKRLWRRHNFGRERLRRNWSAAKFSSPLNGESERPISRRSKGSYTVFLRWPVLMSYIGAR